MEELWKKSKDLLKTLRGQRYSDLKEELRKSRRALLLILNLRVLHVLRVLRHVERIKKRSFENFKLEFEQVPIGEYRLNTMY